MISNCASVSVLWNEAPRAERLLSCLRDNFAQAVVVVQESDDDTLEIARRTLAYKDVVVPDEWRGGGDFSMPLALSHVSQPWAFVISGDEYPSDALLKSIPTAIETMERDGNNGAFIEFTEMIEGLPYIEHGRHVRLFRSYLPWEARHHSAAPHENTIKWRVGHIQHDRTLDEVVRDYLRKLNMMEEEGLTNLQMVNKRMLYRACTQTADAFGWSYVHKYDWWPEVQRRVFSQVPSKVEMI